MLLFDSTATYGSTHCSRVESYSLKSDVGIADLMSFGIEKDTEPPRSTQKRMMMVMASDMKSVFNRQVLDPTC